MTKDDIETAAPESLEKVRDILFGAQTRDTKKRFQQLEERLKKDSRELREDTRKRLDSMEASFKNEVKTVLERIRAENHERTAALKDLGRDLGVIVKDLEKRVAKLDERSAKDQRDLRKQVLEQSKAIRDEISQAQAQLEAAQEEAVEELRGDAVERKALGEMFSEIAGRLKNGSQVRK